MTETSKLGHLEVLYALTNEIEPHPENANVGDVELIKESIRINGLYTPVVVQSTTGYILVGNHRFRAAKEMGYEQVPVIYLDVDDEEAKRIMVVDNRSTRLGHDDETALAALLEQIGESETGLLGTGYNHAELQTLLDAQERFSEEFQHEPDPATADRKPSDYITEPIPGAGGTCVGVMVQRFDSEPLTAADYNNIRAGLGLQRSGPGALSQLGIEDWE